MSEHNQSIPLVIIGCGFSAAALVAHLCADAPERAQKIMIIGSLAEPNALGSGAAFGTVSDHFRLNVRSDIMKLFSDEDDDFGEWANSHIDDPKAKTDVGQFYRRRDYARYLHHRLTRICSLGLPEYICDEVTNLRKTDKGWQIKCLSKAIMTAENIVLATGNPPPKWNVKIDQKICQSEGLVENPWSGKWLDTHHVDNQICFIGGGLTALDGLYALHEKEFAGKITLITPQGLLPPKQADWVYKPHMHWPEECVTASKMLHFMRSCLKQTSQNWDHKQWQEVLESLRGNLNSQWRKLPSIQKIRLMKAAGKWWNLARYRAAPQNIAAIQQMHATGQLRIIASRVKAISQSHNAYSLSLENGSIHTADKVINCSGTAPDPLLAKLIAERLIHPCAFGIGPELSDRLEVLDNTGKAYKNCFALGAMTKGSCGDVVGAGTIARQAQQLSSHLGDMLEP